MCGCILSPCSLSLLGCTCRNVGRDIRFSEMCGWPLRLLGCACRYVGRDIRLPETCGCILSPCSLRLLGCAFVSLFFISLVLAPSSLSLAPGSKDIYMLDTFFHRTALWLSQHWESSRRGRERQSFYAVIKLFSS